MMSRNCLRNIPLTCVLYGVCVCVCVWCFTDMQEMCYVMGLSAVFHHHLLQTTIPIIQRSQLELQLGACWLWLPLLFLWFSVATKHSKIMKTTRSWLKSRVAQQLVHLQAFFPFICLMSLIFIIYFIWCTHKFFVELEGDLLECYSEG